LLITRNRREDNLVCAPQVLVLDTNNDLILQRGGGFSH
jgi:hypothetical protein